MSQNANDLRVKRTRKLLREALITLIEERGFDGLTVEEIAQRAMVSRTAFYRYYQDKYDLVEQIFAETMVSLHEAIAPKYREVLSHFAYHPPLNPWAELFSSADARPVPEAWISFFAQIAEHQRFYRALLGKKGSSWFVGTWRASLAEGIQYNLQEITVTINQPSIAKICAFADGLVPTLLAAQLIDTITWWLEQESPYPPRQIATYYYRLRSALLKEMGTWE
ncbi:TetR/AcrR family transcriptional regulator [Ktedonosporobacter rubrisoli]|uniref:TetR/AcrR family transcriptional regulator n=1 Tax=Ktedonosporobacter rubrisoli TaxID=2509675 RepID=A0A4P6JJ18_KTERU|nr:TetR/AcrR family transcriptional regulator [Ktedonosporobacter rubrisoli]QBD75078.1 TetR/AcrR family transcriptional regulator [Ktedonosporobacter rubrisoli]